MSIHIARKRKYSGKCRKKINSHLANQAAFWPVNWFFDSSLEGFPNTWSKNIIHNLLFPLISEVCCLCSRPASFLQTEVFIKLQLMRNWALAGSPLPPELSWSLARERESVCKAGGEPLGSISCLATLTQRRRQADVLEVARIVCEQNLCAFGSRPKSQHDQVCPAFHYLVFVSFFPVEKEGCDLEAPGQH